MAVLDDINAVLGEARTQLVEIRSQYADALHAQALPRQSSVKIKNYTENLRSVLDYVASDIWQIVLGQAKPRNVYFPITTASDADFRGRMAKDFPDLDTKNAALFKVLADVQAFRAGGCDSLPKLSKLVNENKHNQLSPNMRTETRTMEIKFPGGASISGAGTISGHGTLSSGGGWISPAGGVISPDSPAHVGGGGVTQCITVWVSFKFTETGDEVLGLLKACACDVERVLSQVKPHLWRPTA